MARAGAIEAGRCEVPALRALEHPEASKVGVALAVMPAVGHEAKGLFGKAMLGGVMRGFDRHQLACGQPSTLSGCKRHTEKFYLWYQRQRRR